MLETTNQYLCAPQVLTSNPSSENRTIPTPGLMGHFSPRKKDDVAGRLLSIFFLQSVEYLSGRIIFERHLFASQAVDVVERVMLGLPYQTNLRSIN